MTHIWESRKVSVAVAELENRRSVSRRPLAVPARLAWKDQRGVNRFATVMTRDVSEFGVYVESTAALSLPLYRLVQFQLEPTVRASVDIPESLRHGRILSAVYRVSHGTKNARHGVALRLMAEPKRMTTIAHEGTRATA